ncbi:MAG: peptidase M23 [Gammaproteobacteria bacterium]|nr:MAG: peptidase M23 [Gammaproteobacteria bacterium]
MQIIIIPSDNSTHKYWQLTRNHLYLFLAVIAAMMVAIVWGLNKAAAQYQSVAEVVPSATVITVEVAETASEQQLQDYYAQRLGHLQAESIRLKALTEKLANMAGISLDVFVLDEKPAQGGIESQGESISSSNLKQQLSSLDSHFKLQDTILSQLQRFYITDEHMKSAIPQGLPSKEGWISSYYGYRIDPFNGKKVFHHGLDIAGKSGSEVLAVADGIISWTGKKTGYGQLIEIDHGNGYLTRYAHNKSLIVKVGDRVKKKQPIALMGSTGRSTGPHVHYEVLLDGKMINPKNFVSG